MAKDSAVRIEIGRSFHQLGTVQVKVRESDLVPLWDGTTRRRSLAERKLLEGHKFELASLGILVQCQLWSCRQNQYLEFDASGYW